MYQLRDTIGLATSIQEAWDFFSSPANLKVITPPHLGFDITSDPPESIYPGLIISYTVRPILHIPLEWVTEITQVDAPRYFVDEQRKGPYTMWHHEHIIHEHDKGVVVEDCVSYLMPFGLLGKIAHSLMVKRQLGKIFSYRQKALSERFETFSLL